MTASEVLFGKIVIIGGGSMGAAFAEGFLKGAVIRPRDLVIVESSAPDRDALRERFGCVVTADIDQAHDADLVFIAVKPQDAERACESIRPHLSQREIIVSAMAGVAVPTLSRLLGGFTRIVRCMPNLPVEVRKGLTVFFAHPSVPPTLVRRIDEAFSQCGTCLQVLEEDKLNAATAISGSGPGYVAYLLEYLEQAAVKLGFSPDEARVLVTTTVAGTAELLEYSHEAPETLRKRVTSKGGTTEAAVATFQNGKVGECLVEGVLAAGRRARELGKAFE
jgi:pyrroline-5-carboxylate reductase